MDLLVKVYALPNSNVNTTTTVPIITIRIMTVRMAKIYLKMFLLLSSNLSNLNSPSNLLPNSS